MGTTAVRVAQKEDDEEGIDEQDIFHRAGCEFSRVHTRLILAIVEAKSGSRGWCRQKNAWHAGAACRMAGA
jgi:hypothetical protein